MSISELNVLPDLSYIGVLLLTLIVWDVMDFFIVLKRFDFLRLQFFWFNYLIRTFFSVVILETIFTLNLIPAVNKFIIAFLTPLLFPLIIQKLALEVGGVEINIREVFSEFRETIIAGMQSYIIRNKVRVQTELLKSSLSNEDFKQQCRFLAPSSSKFEILENLLSKKNDEEARVGYIQALVGWGGIESAEALLKERSIMNDSV
jgi:hypothetical protein